MKTFLKVRRPRKTRTIGAGNRLDATTWSFSSEKVDRKRGQIFVPRINLSPYLVPLNFPFISACIRFCENKEVLCYPAWIEPWRKYNHYICNKLIKGYNVSSMNIIWQYKALKQLKKIGDSSVRERILHATRGLEAFPTVPMSNHW
jgi:hypothetical protein